MYRIHEKGTQVNHIENNALRPADKTGLLAMFRAFLRAGGRGRPLSVASVRESRPLALVLLATPVVALALTVCASPALASSAGPPDLHWVENSSVKGYDNSELALYVFPTHMSAEANIYVNELNTKWRTEYSTNESALEKDSGTVASSGEESDHDEVENIRFGTRLPGLEQTTTHILHHLTPATHYYAQFVAENSDGKAVLPFEFTTLPLAKPEIARGITGQGHPDLFVSATSPTTVIFEGGRVESNGAATTYSFGLSTSPSGPATPCASGSVSVAEDFAVIEGTCTGLAPETTYYVRLLMSNEQGATEQTTYEAGGGKELNSVTTPTDRPIVGEPDFRNVTDVSAHVRAGVLPHHEETRWRFESAPSALGPWTPVPGAAGTISQAQAEALPEGAGEVEAALTGLSSATPYYVRLFAENTAGEGQDSGFGEPISTEIRGFGDFETAGPPTIGTLAVHSLQGESLRVIGAVDPNSEPTSAEQSITIEGAPTSGTFTLTFDGHTTGPIPFDAPAEGVRDALMGLPGEPDVSVSGLAGGPYTVYFGGQVGLGPNPLGEKAQPPIVADASGLTPSGAVTVAVTQQGGVADDTHYHFEYVSQQQFDAPGGDGGFAKANSTPEVDAGSGTATKFVAVDLSGLTPGETYRYRLVATSTFPGNPVVDGSEQILSVPAPLAPEPVTSCPNEALRTGPSGNLPDCRGYEQLTPVHKEGAREPFDYGTAIGSGAAIGEAGDRVVLEDEVVNWGAGPAAGQSPYFFSREEAGGWRMTASATQPETGVNRPVPQLLAPNLTELAFTSSFETSAGSQSKVVAYRTGPPGGPYATVANVPIAQAGPGDIVAADLGWVGASQDFSKLFLEVADPELVEPKTATKSGEDLYEYTGGELRQVNVSGPAPGVTIGACGARIVKGDEEAGHVSSAHAVSADGSRVFFEAVPGRNCSEPKHLYMREDGERTVDFGADRFLAADSEGTEVLLEKQSGGAHEVLLDLIESGTVRPLFVVHRETAFVVSEELTAIYFTSTEQLIPDAPPTTDSSTTDYVYRYDIPTATLSFVDSGFDVRLAKTSPDGRYLYLEAKAVEGVPGGEQAPERNDTAPQVYRYDSAENLLQCMACASPFDPEPKLISIFGDTGGNGGMLESRTGSPRTWFASGNGDYVFFGTPSALLSSDVDGEVAPNPQQGGGNESSEFSTSSDVYEWRKPGVDGCAHLQGCLALITSGRGGFLNLFLGTDESGRDAFIYTSSPLLAQDNDTAGDIYDVRIGGGTPPPPPRAVECEGDACSTPPGAPNDATPSSLTFSGPGNAPPTTASSTVPTTKKTTKKKVKPQKKRTKRKRKGKRAANKAKRAIHVGRGNQ